MPRDGCAFAQVLSIATQLERRTLSLNQENISDHGIHFWWEVIRDAEALFA